MSISVSLKVKVWDKYIGRYIAEIECPLCENEKIRVVKFHCSHVHATSLGGDYSLENLRPICSTCNTSMGNTHMKDYAIKFFPTSPLIPGLPNKPTAKKITKNIIIPSHPEKNTCMQRNVLLDVNTHQYKNTNLVISEVKTQPIVTVQINPADIGSKIKCPNCEQTFVRNANLLRHLRSETCTKPKQSKKDLEKIIQQKDAVIEKFISHHHVQSKFEQIDNKNLNIMCLTSKDNLLELLSQNDSLHNALIYMKGCALKKIDGDCMILEKVYHLTTQNPAIVLTNKKKSQYVYYNERRRQVTEKNTAVMAKKLADILQRSYLIGMEGFQTDLSGARKISTSNVNLDSLPELDPYDLQLWNEHIHELRDEKYQKKLLKRLKIQTESEVN
jgi:hypothetical protein